VVRGCASRVELQGPDEEEIQNLLKATVRRINKQNPIEASMTSRELSAMVRNLRGLTRQQIRQVIAEAVITDRRLDSKDLPKVLARKRDLIRSDGLLEFVEAPTSMDDIGGLSRLKFWLRQREQALTEDAAKFGIEPPRGILMLGVQGAGKSLCAKAIATAWKRPLMRLDPSVLYDRFIGESERRLRDALRQAEMMAPVVLWIDEIEKGFASAASHSIDGGLSQRMFGTLLSWMQEHRHPVFLATTANDIEALPPELLRKGRFDEIFFVDLPSHAARKAIAAIHLKKRGRDPARFDTDRLATASDGYSGAEIEQAVMSALHEAFSAGGELSTELIERCLKGSPPLSVTMSERIHQLREWAKGRCVPAE
jgi:SpoVK/Ycf46/Vps4 family AAA+-type ATPase